MNLYLRLLSALLNGVFKSRLHLLQPGICFYRVMPWDIDVYGHMNNGRYLQISDVARIEHMCRTHAAKIIFRKRWAGILGGSIVRHSRSLKLFQKYRVISKVLSWDERWFYVEHRFETLDSQEVAVCISRAALRSRQGWAGTEDIVDSVAPGLNSPEHPRQVEQWLAADQSLYLEPAPVASSRVA